MCKKKRFKLRDCLKCKGACCKFEVRIMDGYKGYKARPLSNINVFRFILHLRDYGIIIQQDEEGLLTCPKQLESGLCSIYEKKPDPCTRWHCGINDIQKTI